jgi:hypothetical protein
MLNQNSNTTSPAGTPIPTTQKALPKKRKLPLYLAALLVAIVAFAGIGISLRQYLIRDTVAPTAPTESQASVDKIQSCSLSFDVSPPDSGINCTKISYRDELSNTSGEYELITQQNTFAPGDTIVYSFEISNTGEQTATITASDRLNINIADDVIFDYEFLDSNCGEGAYQDRSLTCTAENLPAGETETFTFRIKLSDQIVQQMTLSNEVLITDGIIDNICSVDVEIIITTTEAYCNETCVTNVDCVEENNTCIDDVCRLATYPESETCEEPVEPSPTPEITPTPIVDAYCGEYCDSNTDCVQDDQTCYNDECRLATNPTSATCEPEIVEPSPTPETVAYCGDYCSSNSDCIQGDQICYFNECRLADYPDRNDCTAPEQVVTTTTYVEPTPTVGCNENCLTNRDCSNNDQICYEGSCRLGSYPASTSCTVPTTPINPSQPKMPEELPQSGSDDLINWIKAGIGILGAGALLLLL